MWGIIMAYRYANFYVARPPIQERVVRAQYATLAQNHTAALLLGAVSRPSELVVMAYLGRDSKIHVIHRIVEHVASLEYPSPRFEGNFIGLMDKVGKFGVNLGAIEGEFFEELVMDSVPSAQDVAVALAATPSGHQLAVAANEAATRLTVRFGVMAALALQPIVNSMIALGNASRERDTAKEDFWYAEAQEKVAPSTIWESGIGSLWHICQVRDDAGLPEIWAWLAKVGLKHGRHVLAAAANEPPNTPLYSLPTVGQFCDGHDDLEGCLLIFAVSYPSQDSVMAANE
jgi:hypothetical protein